MTNELEPCGDAVSRQAVMNIVKDMHGLARADVLSDAVKRLKDLPPVTQKSGKWINDKNDIPICSRCGYIPQYDRAIDDYEYSNYCPLCGADMREEQTE